VAKMTYENQVQIRPFWYYATSYYVLLFAFSCLVSVAISIVLTESDEEFSFLLAIIIFLFLFSLGMFVRGRIKKRIRTQILLENNKHSEKFRIRQKSVPEKKLSNSDNDRFVAKIEKKSEAAKLLGNLSEVHKEVFEHCNAYLSLIDDELKTVGVGSPRMAGLRRGRDKVRKIHKEHLLKWVANESSELTRTANALQTSTERVTSGNRVLSVLKIALDYYPTEKRLIESIFAVNEFINTAKRAENLELSRDDNSKTVFVEAEMIGGDSTSTSTSSEPD
jgi:hypothetical protein